jgi:hypothetical protein
VLPNQCQHYLPKASPAPVDFMTLIAEAPTGVRTHGAASNMFVSERNTYPTGLRRLLPTNLITGIDAG